MYIHFTCIFVTKLYCIHFFNKRTGATLIYDLLYVQHTINQSMLVGYFLRKPWQHFNFLKNSFNSCRNLTFEENSFDPFEKKQ